MRQRPGPAVIAGEADLGERGAEARRVGRDPDVARQRGLEAGAAYYLTKGSFHDETLLQAVVDLIGEAAA